MRGVPSGMNTTRQSVSCSVALVWASRRSAGNWSAAASTRQRLQQGEQDDDPDSENDAHNGHGRQDLGQGVTTLVPTNAGDVRPYHAHGLLVDADTGGL